MSNVTSKCHTAASLSIDDYYVSQDMKLYDFQVFFFYFLLLKQNKKNSYSYNKKFSLN